MLRIRCASPIKPTRFALPLHTPQHDPRGDDRRKANDLDPRCRRSGSGNTAFRQAAQPCIAGAAPVALGNVCTIALVGDRLLRAACTMGRLISTGIPSALLRSLARQIAMWRADDPFGCILVIVPNSTTATSLRDELPLAAQETSRTNGPTGLFNVEIVTLAGWARRLALSRLMASGRKPLPRFVSLAVVAEAIRRTKRSTMAFLPASAEATDPRDRPNFQHTVLTEIMNLKKAGVTPEDLGQRGDARFARETAAIYEASEEILRQGGWADLSDILVEAAGHLEASASLHDTPGAVLFGFTEANALEQNLIRALTNATDETAAFVPWLSDAPAFALTASFVGFLSTLWQARPVHAEPDVASPASALVRDLFHPEREAIQHVPEISFLSAPDPVQEWRELARHIWKHVERAPDLRFSDIFIVAPNVSEIRSVARDVFAQAGIPLFEVRGISLLESEAARSLTQLLDTIDSGMTRSAVLELVTTCPLKPDWTASEKGPVPPAEWDRITRLAGVIGGLGSGRTVQSEWLDRLRGFSDRLAYRIERHRPGFEEEGTRESKERMETDRAYAERLSALVATLDGIRARVMLSEQSNRWAEWISAVREGWHRLFGLTEEGDAIVEIEGLLDEMSRYDAIARDIRAPLPPPPVRRRMLSDALRGKSVPPRKDRELGVWIGDFTAVAYRRPAIVIITGLADSQFPRTEQPSALAVFDAQDVVFGFLHPLPGETAAAGGAISIDRAVAQDHLHYAMALCSARERIYLSYPRLETGKDTERLPSSVFIDTLSRLVEPDRDGTGKAWDERALRRALSERGEWRFARAIPEPGDVTAWLNADEFDLAYAGILGDTPLGGRWVERLSSFSGRGRALLCSRQAGVGGRYDGSVWFPALAEQLARPVDAARPVSPSRLETYATCPFRYFVQYVLGIGPLPEPTYEPTLDPLRFGRILHNLLAGFYRHLREIDALPFDRRAPQEYRGLFDEFAARRGDELALAIDLPAPVVWQIEWKTVLERAWRAVHASIADRDRWNPRYMELGLGVVERYLEPGSSLEPIRIEIEGHGPVALHGIVDRVDVSRDGTSARIMDYKSGKRPRLSSKAGHTDAGRRVQVLVYAVGVEEWLRRRGEARGVAEVCYHYLRTEMPDNSRPGDRGSPILSLDETVLPAALEELRHVLGVLLGGIRSGEFAPIPDSAPNRRFSTCSTCDVSAACGSLSDLAVRWKRIVADKRAEPLVTLRGASPVVEETGDDDAP